MKNLMLRRKDMTNKPINAPKNATFRDHMLEEAHILLVSSSSHWQLHFLSLCVFFVAVEIAYAR
jgi:hypothetical protein